VKTYIAKSPHKWPCDLCGSAILVGDRVKPWCWTSEDGPGEGYGGICRTHVTCYAIGEREQLMVEALVAFEDEDETRWNDSDVGAAGDSMPDDQYFLSIEADAALAADRLARPTTSLAEVERRIVEAMKRIEIAATTHVNGEHQSAYNLARHVLTTIRTAAEGDPYAWLVRK
jgi:hypothetical protein